MAYFSNGTEGDILDRQCAECLPHDPCPIAKVQVRFNYTQCKKGQEELRRCMNMLVDEEGQCLMKQYVE